MHIKQVWRAVLVATTCLWAGSVTPAAAQLFGINLGTSPATTATPETAPGKPMVLKKYTKHRSARRAHAHSRKTIRRAAKAPARPLNEAQRSHDGAPRDADIARTNAAPGTTKADAAKADIAQSNPARLDTAKSDTAKPDTAQASVAWPALSPSVANARAELGGGTADARTVFDATSAAPAADPTAAAVPPGSAPAPSPATSPAVEPAPTASTAAAAAPAVASADTAAPVRLMAAAVPSEQTASNTDTPWSRTSLIGKIFVACGGLLMLVSAARLYIG